MTQIPGLPSPDSTEDAYQTGVEMALHAHPPKMKTRKVRKVRKAYFIKTCTLSRFADLRAWLGVETDAAVVNTLLAEAIEDMDHPAEG